MGAERDSPARAITLSDTTLASRLLSRSLVQSAEARVVVRKEVCRSIVKAALLHPPGDARVRHLRPSLALVVLNASELEAV
jgi:hypothetical protein